MKFRPHFRVITPLIVLLLAIAIWVPEGHSLLSPPSRYVGETKKLMIKDALGNNRFGDLEMTMNLPGRNRIRGRVSTSESNLPGFPFDTKIFGKLRSSEIRRGGGKWILQGRWAWKMNVNRVDKRGIGRFRSTIIRNIDTSGDIAVFNYDIRWPIRIQRISSDPEKTYRVTGRYLGKTNS